MKNVTIEQLYRIKQYSIFDLPNFQLTVFNDTWLSDYI